MSDTDEQNGSRRTPTSLCWARREALGLSREHVSRLLDPPVTTKTLERWEKGVTPVKRWRLEQIARVYGCRATDLIGDVVAAA